VSTDAMGIKQTVDCETSLQTALHMFAGVDSDASRPDNDDAKANDGRRDDPAITWNNPVSGVADLRNRGLLHMHRFAVLPSRKRPRWLLPLLNGNQAAGEFNLYKPFSPTARLMKSLIVRMCAHGWHALGRQTIVVASKQPLAIERLVTEITGEQHCTFALSLGTPGTYQKLTVQVSRTDGNILGYFKMPITSSAGERLHNEAAFLRKLSTFPQLRPHIPQLLFAGDWNNNTIVFQSPLDGETGPVSFTKLYQDFLQALQHCEPTRIAGKLLAERMAGRWEKLVPRLAAKWLALGREALKTIMQELSGATIPCGFHHGDFAPWNARVHRGKLFVFDWESARYDAPSLWDQFHFLTQTECVLKAHHAASSLVREQNRSLYLLYLLDSTIQAVEEEARQFAIDYREKEIRRCLAPQLMTAEA
jgi:hypothetical protein